MSSQSPSFAVETPNDLEALRLGNIGADRDIVVVTFQAHPDVLSQPLHFTNSPCYEISFVSESTEFGSNVITLYPSRRIVSGWFHSGENLTLGMPSDFSEYRLGFHEGSVLYRDDLDYILQWRDATVLEIFDEIDNDVAYQLSWRVDDLARLFRLESITFTIHFDTYEKLQLAEFLKRLPALKEAIFYAKGISMADVEAFMATELSVGGWDCETSEGYGRPFIRCTKEEL